MSDDIYAKKLASADDLTIAEGLEADILLDKSVTCPVCDNEFKEKWVRETKLRRQEPDDDLRPNHKNIDVIKYGVSVCPNCGYAALKKSFTNITKIQRKWVTENISANYKHKESESDKIYNYGYAVDRHKLALLTAMVKKSRKSEIAYLCLCIAWLRRQQIKFLAEHHAINEEKIKKLDEEYRTYYSKAYEGFVEALAQEDPPFAGMDSNTLEYIMAQIAIFFHDYDSASKIISRLLVSSSVSYKMKDKLRIARELLLSEKEKEE